MKTIRSFIMSPRHGYSVDLEDRRAAVRVTPNSGTVVLNEGEGPDRISGWSVAGSDVVRFEVTRASGIPIVRFVFTGPYGTSSHTVGHAPDVEEAEIWVLRVNRLYERRARDDGRPVPPSLPASCARFPVVCDICSTGETWAQPDDYSYSAESQPVDPYHIEHYQEYLLQRQIDLLRQDTGFEGPIARRMRPRIPHNYIYLATSIRYGGKNFGARVTQPLELIFDRAQRRDDLGVVPAGHVNHFALVYACGREAEGRLQLRPGEPAAESFRAWTEMVRSTATNSDRLVICTPSNHSVDYSIYEAMLRGEIDPSQRASAAEPWNLAKWLFRWMFQGLVACDIGVAYQVMAHFRRESDAKVNFSLVPYENPVTVGFGYRVDDPKWGGLLRQALADCLKTSDSKVRESYEAGKVRAARVGVHLLDAAA